MAFDLLTHSHTTLQHTAHHQEYYHAHEEHFDSGLPLRADERPLGLFIAELVEKAFGCKTGGLVTEDISLEVNSASVHETRGALLVALEQRGKVELDRGVLEANHYLAVVYEDLRFHDVGEVLEVAEVELHN